LNRNVIFWGTAVAGANNNVGHQRQSLGQLCSSGSRHSSSNMHCGISGLSAQESWLRAQY
jgi:hypothetical protein